MTSKPTIYMDSCCFIDAVKQAVGNLPTERDSDVWHIKKLMEAHRAGDVQVFTSIVSLAECLATEQAQNPIPEDVKVHFRNMLLNGQFLTLALTTPQTGTIARDFRWNHGLVLGSPDALHLAAAVEVGASEFITTDERIQKAKFAPAVNHFASSGNMMIIKASDTQHLPGDYRQGEMLNA